ncbi:MAG: CBS domain-containing protein, partial [Cyanobacteria bacterium J06639_18]
MEPNNKLIDFCDLNRVIDVSPLTVTPDTLVVDAIPLMLGEGQNYSNKFGLRGKLSQPNKTDRNPKDYVLVVEGLSLVGIFTYIDIVRLAGSGINFSGLRISEVMTQQVISLKISPNHDIFTLRSLMHRHEIHHLPILDWEDKLVGIITHNNLQQVFAVEEKTDLIPGLQKQLKSQENHLKEVQEELYQTRSELKQQVNRFEKANICCKREIKVRSQIEAQINFQANVLAHVSDAVIAIDNEHHVVYLNRRAEQLYDIEADEF